MINALLLLPVALCCHSYCTSCAMKARPVEQEKDAALLVNHIETLYKVNFLFHNSLYTRNVRFSKTSLKYLA